MKAFMLTAGYGERLRPITDLMPKPLAPLCNVPCLCYGLALLKESGVREAVCNLHYRPADIEKYLENNNAFGLFVEFSREDPILDTGGGLKNCENLFRDEPLLLMNGDIVTDLDLGQLIRRFGELNPAALVVLRRVGAGEPGTVAVEGERIRDFRGVLGSGLDHRYDYTGIAVLSPEIFRYLRREPSSIVYTAYTELAQQGRAAFYVHEGLWTDIGTPAHFRSANMAVMDNSALRERVAAGTGLIPAEVSADAAVENGAVVARSVVGSGCIVRDGAEVRESVMLPGTIAAAGQRITKSVAVRDGIIIEA